MLMKVKAARDMREEERGTRMTVPEKRTPRGNGASANNDTGNGASLAHAEQACNDLADARAYSDWCRLARGYAVRFELVDGRFRAFWDPRVPPEADSLMRVLAAKRAAAFVLEVMGVLQ
jgi:hypothetical protein